MDQIDDIEHAEGEMEADRDEDEYRGKHDHVEGIHREEAGYRDQIASLCSRTPRSWRSRTFPDSTIDPCSSIWPWVASASAVSMFCSASITAAWTATSEMAGISCSTTTGATPSVGSSIKTRVGSTISACANPSILRSPPE